MQTPKEALLALIKGEPYDMIPEYYSTVKSLVFPGERWIDMLLLQRSASRAAEASR